MAKILIHCNHQNYAHPDTTKDEQGVYKKGYIVEVRESGTPEGNREGLPRFVWANVTDATKQEVEDMISTAFGETSIMQSWVRKMNWQTSALSIPLDAWHVVLSTQNPGATNKGLITRAMAERFIEKWNGRNIEFSSGQVEFDIAIFEAQDNPGAIQSEGFWGVNVSNVVFTEISYDSSTGEHQIEADYSALTNANPTNIENRVTENRGTIDSHDTENKVITFTISRVDVSNEFKEEVRNAVETIVYRRQFKIPEATVDNIISQGGSINITLEQLENYLENMLDIEL